MSRIANALDRARTRSEGRASGDHDSGADIVFFDPSQSAVVSADVVAEHVGRIPAWNTRHQLGRAASSTPSLPGSAGRVERRYFTDLPPRHGLATVNAGSDSVFPNTLTVQGREEYRRLTATLHQAQLEHGVKVVLVTSALPREGKTFTVTNLAAAFGAAQRRRVLLIDADLRSPMVHRVFRTSNTRGLADSLATGGPLPVTPAAGGLSLLTAGRTSGDPLETLTSDCLRALILEARDVFDWILLDTPPVGVVSDATVLAPLADATVLVVLAEQTAYDVVQGAVEALGPDRMIGVVLNRVNGSVTAQGAAAQEYCGRR